MVHQEGIEPGSPSRASARSHSPMTSEKNSSFDETRQYLLLQSTEVYESDRLQMQAEILSGHPEEEAQTAIRLWPILWMVVNTAATVAIVFTNKAIFSDPGLKLAQLSFAAFHFFVTWLTLYTLSRPYVGLFVPCRTAILDILPLSTAMALNVILPNLSLAFSSISFYQVARVLLTPTVALMNFVMYRNTLPQHVILALVPTCLGVAMASYYDSLPVDNASVKTTSGLGVIFAFCGVFASSLYTVWVASYRRKLQLTSMQLLFNQAPVSGVLLLYVIPFVDTLPNWTTMTQSTWTMVIMSGILASLINISQFFIIAQTGPVSSTVVGHVKTCTILTLGWATSGRSVGDKSVLGILMAVAGIIMYSIIMRHHHTAAGSSNNK